MSSTVAAGAESSSATKAKYRITNGAADDQALVTRDIAFLGEAPSQPLGAVGDMPEPFEEAETSTRLAILGRFMHQRPFKTVNHN